jgi:hypothetical protein
MDEKRKKYIVEEMRKSRALPRYHASFFNSHDKKTKELFIGRILLRYLIKENNEVFDIIDVGSDPPDCIATSNGVEIAIEIVELVDQKAIENEIRYKEFYPDQEPWNKQRLEEHVNKLLLKKDNPPIKDYLVDKYRRYIALIHTDEPELRVSYFDMVFDTKNLVSTNLITEAYLLFSYDPTYNCYPVRRLR